MKRDRKSFVTIKTELVRRGKGIGKTISVNLVRIMPNVNEGFTILYMSFKR